MHTKYSSWSLYALGVTWIYCMVKVSQEKWSNQPPKLIVCDSTLEHNWNSSGLLKNFNHIIVANVSF